MLSTLALLGLYACAIAVVRITSHALRRPIPAAPLGALAALPLLIFPQSFFSDRTPLPLDHARSIAPWQVAGSPAPHNPDLNDVALQFLPWAKATRVAFKGGELPLRNRWSGTGTPLAANAQSGAFSPFTLLGLVLPLARAFTLIVGLKILLAGTGMWLFASELAISRIAAFFASVCFALSFAMTAWLLFPHSAVLCLWPWMLFLIERLRSRDGGRLTFAALTLCFWAMALSGHPETLVLGIVLATLWILGRRLTGALPEGYAILGKTLAAGALASGLAAWLLIPELAAIRASNRLQSMTESRLPAYLSARPHGPIDWSALITSGVPHALGNPIGPHPVWGGPGAFPELALGYAGVLPLLFALLLLRPGAPRRPEELTFAILALVALALAVGQWPFLEVVTRLPGINNISPFRFLAWLAICVPLLAAFELDRWIQDAPVRRSARGAPAVAAAVLALGAVLLHAHFESRYALAGVLRFERQELMITLLLLTAAAGLTVFFAKQPRALAMSITVIAAAELLRGATELYRTFPTNDMYPQSPLLLFVRSQPGTFRVVGDGAVLFPDSSVFAGLEDVRTHDPVERRDYVDFLDATCGYRPLDYFKILRNVNAPALDFLNVRYLIGLPGRAAPGLKWRLAYADASGTVFENASALPRAFAPRTIQRVRAAGGDSSHANRLFGDAYREIAATRDWAERAFVLTDRETGSRQNPAVVITDYEERTNSASFRVRATAPALVVASLTQDGGWTARDESGRTLRVRRANGPFLAVETPAGEHFIRLRYSPPGFLIGLWIALASFLAGALILKPWRLARSTGGPIAASR